MLSPREVESFVEDGYVAVPGAVPVDVVRACREMIWSGLARHGVTEDPGTWTEPVVRIACPEGGPFAEAGTRGPVGGLRPAHRGRALVASARCGRHYPGPLPEPDRPR